MSSEMSPNDKRVFDFVKDIIEHDIIPSLRSLSTDRQHYNERYLHHLFSKLVQDRYPVRLDYASSEENRNSFSLHPEWATSISEEDSKREEDPNREGGLYRFVKSKEDGNHYEKVNRGFPGFIDFAIGNFKNPSCAIEFKMSEKFDKNAIAYDYMKLLDADNHLKSAVSLVVYYGHRRPSKYFKIPKGKSLPDALNNLSVDAVKDLGKFETDPDRPYAFYIVEVLNGKINNCFYCDNNAKGGKFERKNFGE